MDLSPHLARFQQQSCGDAHEVVTIGDSGFAEAIDLEQLGVRQRAVAVQNLLACGNIPFCSTRGCISIETRAGRLQLGDYSPAAKACA